MKILTETSSFDADITIPEDSVDQRTAASLETAFQRLTNRSKWLSDKGIVRDLQFVRDAQADPTSSHQAFVSGTGWQQVTSVELALDAQASDLIVVVASLPASVTNVTTTKLFEFKFTLESTSHAQADMGNSHRHWQVDGGGLGLDWDELVTIWSLEAATFSETYTVKTWAKLAANFNTQPLAIAESWQILGAAIKSPV